MTETVARRVLFFEPEVGGHQASFVSHILEYAAGLGPDLEPVFAVALGLRDFLPTAAAERLFDTGGAGPLARPISAGDLESLNQPSRWRRSLARWRYVNRLAAAAGADHAHFLFFDHALLGAALSRPRRLGHAVSGLLFRPTIHYGEIGGAALTAGEKVTGRYKDWLYRIAIGHPDLQALMTLDPYFADFARELYAAGRKVVAVPDPVPIPRERLAAPPGGTGAAETGGRVTCLIFGALQRRKGVLVLLEALARLNPTRAAACRMVFAGRIDPAIREAFESARSAALGARPELEIEVDDRFLDDDELVGLVRSSDVVLAPYQRHVGSSGVLYWAAAAGKPVIAQDFGLVGRETRDCGLGLTADCRSPAALAAAIDRAVACRGQDLADAAGQARYIEGHTPEGFAAAIVGTILDGPPARRS